MNYFKCGKYSLPLGKKTYIMGILNVTPDSFSDGGLWNDPQKAADHAREMIEAGADIIDIGAQSTRPGHIEISAAEEIERLGAVFEVLKNPGVPVSVDTYYPEAAEFSLKNGADIINDVSGVFNPLMAEIVKKYNAGWIVMHTGGGTADIVPQYEEGIVENVKTFFEKMLSACKSFGIDESCICLDPGIGFGKTYEDNLTLLGKMNEIRVAQNALLAGASRKRVIGTATGVQQADERLIGTISAHCACMAGGADIIRVHDVAESAESAKMCDAIYRREDR